ncbi:MAG: putative lipid II flippase FtsW [Clostridia bacterium]|nr:putative lipid II flippase FtsW [Clostridia bacterium]
MLKVFKKNWLLVSLVFLLITLGMVFIYSASSYSAAVRYNDSFYFVKKQLVGFLMGLVVMLFFINFNYHKFLKLKWAVVAVSLILLVLVFIPGLGKSNYGANRWITIGGFSLQSSEVAKFGFVIFSACYLSKNYQKTKTFWGVVPIMAVGGVICLLILLEPNLSVTLCVGMVMLIMLVVGGMRAKHFLIILIPIACLVPILIIMEPYRLQRLVAFIDPWASPKEEGFQLIQSLYALGSGGLFGVGLFNSRQKYLFLPFSESDFIFSIIGEELGFVGCVLVITIYAVVIWKGVKIAINASDRLGCYLASGITSIIAVQLLINIAVVTGSIPPTGIPLPFMSAGGTSLMVFMGAVGILLNISKGEEQNLNRVNVFKKLKVKQNKKVLKGAN